MMREKLEELAVRFETTIPGLTDKEIAAELRAILNSDDVTEKRWVLRSKSSGLYWRLKDDGESEYNRLGLATTFSWHPIEGQMEDDEEAISVQVTITTSSK